MKTVSRFLLLAVPLLPLVTHAVPDFALVPADAKWFVHVDLNTLRTSTLGKEIVAKAETELSATNSPVVPNFQRILTTIGTVTAYGTNFSQDPSLMDGTLIAQGTADLRKIAESILLTQTIAAPEQVVELKDFGFPAYGLKSRPHPKPAAKDGAEAKDEAPAKKAERVPGKIEVIVAFPPENIILVSRSKAQINRARDLVRGHGVSLAKAKSSPLKPFLTPDSDAYLFAASETPPENMLVSDAPQARIFRMAKAGSLTLGEHAAEAYAHIELAATDDDTADKLMKILAGLTAIASMTETNDRQLGEFLNAANVTRDNDRVILNLVYPSARLIKMVENMHASENRPRGPQTPQGPYVAGTLADKWTGASYTAPTAGSPNIETTHAIENVALKTGSTITMARVLNGARLARFVRIEITPTAGGMPLVFKSWMPSGPRASAVSFEFPGADGTYNLNIVCSVGDPDGKTEYAVSVRDPRPAPRAGAK